MGRTPCCNHEELKKGAWTVEEDQKLITYIQRHGTGSWRTLPQKAGLQRCGKSCRLRWFNYLRPDIKRGQLSEEEEQTIIKLHAVLGNRWSSIAKHLPMRTDNEIKNYWNSYLKKHLEMKGVAPLSPKPITTATSSSDSEAITTTKSNFTDLYMAPSKNIACHEPNATQMSEPPAHQSRHGSSKSVSSSTQLLNKVARKIVGSGYLGAVKLWQPVAGNSGNDNIVNRSEIGFKLDSIIRQCPMSNMSSISNHSSTSAQLLNKMATSLSQKVHGHEATRAVFSKLMEGCEKSEASDGSRNGSYEVGGCLAGLRIFEDGPQITRIIGTPSSPRLIFNEVTTPLCFSDNEDNWQCVSSNYISFGTCAASGGDSSVSEVNLVSSGSCCIESPNYSTSRYLDDHAPAASAADQSADYLNEIFTCEDEISKYIRYL